MIPSFLLTFSFCMHIIENMIVQTNKMIISVTIILEIGAWAISPTIPRIKDILMILDPTTFPIAISFSPFFAATTDVTSSGRLVPTATIVSPTNASLMPILIAKN